MKSSNPFLARLLLGAVVLALSGEAVPAAAACERVPAEIVGALGTLRGRPVSSGLVFIDGRYIRPPYRVTRAGNQILLNDRPVTGQLVPWKKFLETQSPSKLKATEVEEPVRPAPAPKPSAKPVEDGVDPAAPKDGGNAPPAESGDMSKTLDDLFSRVKVRIVEPRVAAETDALDDFAAKGAPEKMKLTDIPPDSEADRERQKRAEDEKDEGDEGEPAEEGKAEAASTDANGDEIDPASPEGEALAKAKEAAAKKAKPGARMRTVLALGGPFEPNARSRKLLKPIDAYRAMLETTLRRGGYLFFGTEERRYCKGRTSDAMSTKELLRKLPELMREADSAEDFCDAVRSAGLLSYIDLQIAQDLYRHRTGFAALMQRRREFAEAEKLKKLMNGHGR